MNQRAGELARFYRRASVLLAAGVIGLAAAPAAQALELVPGGYGANIGAIVDPAIGNGAAPAGPVLDEGAAGMTLDFTPRYDPGSASSEAPGMHLDLTVRGGDSSLDRLGLGQESPSLQPGGYGADRTSMMVGGAVRWADWSLGGGVGRAAFMGKDMDLLSASVGYGRLSAELSLGQASDYQKSRGDVMMLSTDLAAWSWLTLESDLALGSAPNEDRDDGSVAAGRLGLRLNF